LDTVLNRGADLFADNIAKVQRRYGDFHVDHKRLWSGESFEHWWGTRYRNTHAWPNPGWYGENLAWDMRTTPDLFNAWMNSAAHRANILKSQYRKVGFGQGIDSRGRYYWVAHFTQR
jgi:uncharacterized protein YkwD